MSKISISLPAEVLEEAERECRREGESRSELVRRALGALVSQKRETLKVSAYVAGYVAEPESPAEIASSDELAAEVLAESEWDDAR